MVEKLGAVSFHPSLGQVQSSPGSPQAQEPAPGQQTCMQQGGVWHQESARFAAGRTKPEVLIIALIQTDIHSLLSDHKTFLQQHVQSSRGSHSLSELGIHYHSSADCSSSKLPRAQVLKCQKTQKYYPSQHSEGRSAGRRGWAGSPAD